MESKNLEASFICENINELFIIYRREILQMIYNSPSRNKLKEKGSGTQIKISDLTETLIHRIYTFIDQKLKEQKIDIV